jgi:acetyl esterase/lipase
MENKVHVGIEEGVVIGRAGGRELRADLFSPPAGMSNRTGVLLVHGGGWARGDRTQLRGYGIYLGRLGFTCVACEYRLSGEARWPAQLHDVKAAVRWMRAESAALGIDTSKIAVSGNSAGGHLSLMLAATQGDAASEGDSGSPGHSSEVAATVAFYAPTNLGVPSRAEAEPPALSEAVALLLGDNASAARVREASPVSYVRAGFPPSLLITGNQDELVPGEESVRMYKALRTAGSRAELHVFDGAAHAFDAQPQFGRPCAGLVALFLERYVVRS